LSSYCEMNSENVSISNTYDQFSGCLGLKFAPLDRFDGGRANNGSSPVPVGRYQANPFGLHDTHGNVWEWVQDVWQDTYVGAPVDGSARTSGGDQTRVLRGGSWVDSPLILRSSFRSRFAPVYRNYITGFRIARTF
jgi:formylglycine-generating enzyme required for sulfatase activity